MLGGSAGKDQFTDTLDETKTLSMNFEGNRLAKNCPHYKSLLVYSTVIASYCSRLGNYQMMVWTICKFESNFSDKRLFAK